MPKQQIRLLLVEDSDERAETIQGWVRHVWPTAKVTLAKTAGVAIGIIKRDRGRVLRRRAH